jgi:hypothetical protein
MLDITGQPYFGYTQLVDASTRNVFVRSDLPPHVIASVTAHELYHANDPEFTCSVFERELHANIAGLKGDWLGFLQGIWLSVTDPARLKLYWQRVTKNF